MALRKIALEGEECLTRVCRPVTDFNSRLHTLLDDMADTLAESGGVGLAAPQVGILRRVCVVLDEDDQLIELVNPEIIRTEGEQTGLEGCLSVPGKYGVVTRPEVVRVRAQDRDGEWFEVEDEVEEAPDGVEGRDEFRVLLEPCAEFGCGVLRLLPGDAEEGENDQGEVALKFLLGLLERDLFGSDCLPVESLDGLDGGSDQLLFNLHGE